MTIVFGGNMGERLDGTDKVDHLYGGLGNDALTGGKGADHLEGGTGEDVYIFNSGDGQDTILDTDDKGSIRINGVTLGTLVETLPGLNRYQTAGNIDAYRAGDDLIIRYGNGDRIVVKDWKEGDHDGDDAILGDGGGWSFAPTAWLSVKNPCKPLAGHGFMS